MTGHQRGGGIGMMFGVVGVLAQDAANRSQGRKSHGEILAGMEFDWFALSNELLTELLENFPEGTVSLTEGTNQMEIRPYGVFEVTDGDQANLFTVLELTLTGPRNQKLWYTRYFTQLEGSFPLETASEWVERGDYAEALEDALRVSYEFLLKHMTHQLADDASAVPVRVQVPYVPAHAEVNGKILGETDSHVMVRLHVADALVFSGHHIVSRDKLDIR